MASKETILTADGLKKLQEELFEKQNILLGEGVTL